MSGGLSRRRAILAGLAAAACCVAGGAPAQTLLPSTILPPTGTDVRLGDLRAQVEEALGEAPPRVRGWTFAPALEVDELATDNAFETTNGRHADLVTTITPAITVHGDTPRVQLDLFYAPTALVHAFSAHQNTLYHEANGQALVTIVPNALFLDVRGFASLQSTSGGFSSTGPAPLNQANQSQVASGSVSPYYVHRFDDNGSLRLGYNFNKTLTSSGSQFVPSVAVPVLANSNLTSHEEYGTFRTGENFGRINDQIWIDGVQESGTGLLQNAHRNVLIDQPAYAIDRRLSAYAQIGYEDIAYPHAIPAIRINDAIWAVGFRLTPNPDSLIDVQYGHRDGFNSARVDASYALTGRTKIFARYSEGLATQAEEIASALAGSAVGAGNESFDVLTGAPLLLTNQLIGVQPNLFRVKTLSLTAVTAWPRDTLSLSLLHEEDDLVAVSPGSVGFSDRATSASVTWSHSLSERLNATTYLEYGIYDFSGQPPGSQHFFTLAVLVSCGFTETLSGVAQYVFINRSANLPGQGFLENQALIGLRKTF
jgi:uncharacterized protein (PEP-CTERM system associated)